MQSHIARLHQCNTGGGRGREGEGGRNGGKEGGKREERGRGEGNEKKREVVVALMRFISLEKVITWANNTQAMLERKD